MENNLPSSTYSYSRYYKSCISVQITPYNDSVLYIWSSVILFFVQWILYFWKLKNQINLIEMIIVIIIIIILVVVVIIIIIIIIIICIVKLQHFCNMFRAFLQSLRYTWYFIKTTKRFLSRSRLVLYVNVDFVMIFYMRQVLESNYVAY